MSHLQCASDNVARVCHSLPVDHTHDDIDTVFFKTLEFSKMRDRNESTIDIERVEALAFRPARHVCMKAFARFYQRRENLQWCAVCSGFDLFHDRRHALFCDRQITVRTELRSGFREQEAKEMVNFGNGPNSRFAAAARHTLLDRNGRG